jgi:hypothetical protein
MGYDKEKVWEVIIGYVTSSVRHVGSKKGYMEFITNRHNVANQISIYFNRALHEGDDGRKKSYWEKIEDMGYHVIDIELTKPDLPKDLKDAVAGSAIEKAERERARVRLETYGEMFDGIAEKSPKSEEGSLTDVQVANRALLLMGGEEGKNVHVYEGVGGGLIVNEGQKGGAA